MYVKNHNDIPKQQSLAYSYELSMAELTQGQPVGDIQEGALYEGISLFTQENGSILLYIVSLLI